MRGARKRSSTSTHAKGLLADTIVSITANGFPRKPDSATRLRVFTNSSDPHHHLAAGLARFHHLVCLANFFEAKHAGRFCLIATRSHVLRDGLERHVR